MKRNSSLKKKRIISIEFLSRAKLTIVYLNLQVDIGWTHLKNWTALLFHSVIRTILLHFIGGCFLKQRCGSQYFLFLGGG